MSTSFTTKLANCFPCLTTKLCNIFFARQSVTTVCLTTKWTMDCTCLTTQFASVYRTEQNILLPNQQVGTVPTHRQSGQLTAGLTNKMANSLTLACHQSDNCRLLRSDPNCLNNYSIYLAKCPPTPCL
jgi:hypothetical protein